MSHWLLLAGLRVDIKALEDLNYPYKKAAGSSRASVSMVVLDIKMNSRVPSLDRKEARVGVL